MSLEEHSPLEEAISALREEMVKDLAEAVFNSSISLETFGDQEDNLS
tara:strand:- start:304 stop:444 length:141 start_codon:yes stop_codon:yes gene_type:complete